MAKDEDNDLAATQLERLTGLNPMLLIGEVGHPETVNAWTDPDASCPCVTDHNPNVTVFNRHHIVPLAWGGPDTDENTVLLCPTGHYTVHHLLRAAYALDVHPDELPWELRQKAGAKLREIAAQGWEEWEATYR